MTHLHAEAALADLRCTQVQQVFERRIQIVVVERDVDLSQAFENLGNRLQQIDRLGIGRHRVAPLFEGFNRMTIEDSGL